MNRIIRLRDRIESYFKNLLIRVGYRKKRECGKKEWAKKFKRELTVKFGRWLEKQELQVIDNEIQNKKQLLGPPDNLSLLSDTSSTIPGRVDLFTLFSELKALKQETKIANRQINAEADQRGKIFEFLQQTIEMMQREQNQRRKEMSELKESYLRSLLQDILDIRDRIEQGITASEKVRSSWLGKIAGAEKGRETLIEGQKMTMRNLDRLLASYGVSPVETAGKEFDPFIMRAVEVENRSDFTNGVVLEEIRKGFLLNGQILRPAEVKVNKGKVNTGQISLKTQFEEKDSIRLN